MTEPKAVAEVKREFRKVLDAAEQGEETVVLRHGRPVARITPYDQRLPKAEETGGLLAVAGLFADWEQLDEDVAEIMAARGQTADRSAPEF
jgi:prevent-host-death family protein